ncbi:MAG TPA: hypothetical protein VN649_06460 [Ramlibacter sp.]|nr:hypothetical protein [Ramlibacter sp.]
MTSRFILRFTGAPRGDSGLGLAERLHAMPGVTVLDESPRMLLVDGPAAALKAAVRDFQGWEIVPEGFTPLPDTRVKIGRR